MKRYMQKTTIGAVLIPVGLIVTIIGLVTPIAYGPELVAAGLVATMAGLFEIEIAAVWEKIEG